MRTNFRICRSIDKMSYRLATIHGYGNWLIEEIENGCNPYLITFMFNRLDRQDGPILTQMEGEVERFYATLVTRFERDPRSPKRQQFLPRLRVFPDVPIFKNRKYQYSMRDLKVNGGLHAHGTLTIPEVSRFNGDVRLHIAENQAHYVKKQPRLNRIDIEPIKTQPEYVVDYAFKAFKSGRINPDHMIILPKSITELPSEVPFRHLAPSE